MTHQRGLSRPRRGRGQIVLLPDGSGSTLRQPISFVGHRHHEDRPDTWSPSVPRRSLVVLTVPPRTTPLLILTHGDAADPIPSAVQHGEAAAAAAKTDTFIGERYRRLVERPRRTRSPCRRGTFHPGHRMAAADRSRHPLPRPGQRLPHPPHRHRKTDPAATSPSSPRWATRSPSHPPPPQPKHHPYRQVNAKPAPQTPPALPSPLPLTQVISRSASRPATLGRHLEAGKWGSRSSGTP